MVKVKFLGHAFFGLQFNECSVLIDPYINDPSDFDGKRLIPCSVKEKNISKTDLILISHEHFDHFDKKLIENIAKRDNSIVLGHQSLLNDLNIPINQKKPVDRGRSFKHKGLEVKTVDVHHPTAFYPLGFLLKEGEKSVFHSGDTNLAKCFNEVNANLLILPIGGNGIMDVVDAVKAVKTMKPDYAIPMKYDTFEFIKASPTEFKDKIEKSILKTKPIILKPGQSFEF